MIEQTKFVILAGPRTGSTYLVDFLNTVPGMLCRSELFHDTRIDYRHHRPADPRLNDIGFRDADPATFLALAVAEARDNTWFGFKMVGNQVGARGPEFIRALCRDRSWKKIFLWREDLFSQAISIALAAKHFGTTVWERTPEQHRVAIDPRELLNYLRMVQVLYFVIETALADAEDADVFSVEYAELGRREVMRKLLCFLDVPATAVDAVTASCPGGLAFSPGPSLATKVENYSEICRFFTNTRYRRLLQATEPETL